MNWKPSTAELGVLVLPHWLIEVEDGPVRAYWLICWIWRISQLPIRWLRVLRFNFWSTNLPTTPGYTPYDGAPLYLEDEQVLAQPASHDNVGQAAFRDLMVVNQFEGNGTCSPSALIGSAPSKP